MENIQKESLKFRFTETPHNLWIEYSEQNATIWEGSSGRTYEHLSDALRKLLVDYPNARLNTLECIVHQKLKLDV